jgi:4-diphosphocytidyl-2C-methyl-D-erythritol kinase
LKGAQMKEQKILPTLAGIGGGTAPHCFKILIFV